MPTSSKRWEATPGYERPAHAGAPHPVHLGARPHVRCRFAPHRASAREASQAGGRDCPAHPNPHSAVGTPADTRAGDNFSMGKDPYYFADRDHELRTLIHHTDHRSLQCQLRGAACRGMDPGAFHPNDGQQPDDLLIARCTECPARLACLALALRTEEPDARAGWYGGLGPGDRNRVATDLHLGTPTPPMPEGAVRAAQLKAGGQTIGEIATTLGCSRRTVQRYLRMIAIR